MSTLDTDLRVVQNIWKIYDAAPPHTVEDFISSYLVQDDWKARCKSFTKFGIFWRISDGVPDSSIAFTNPLFIMVNLLKHNNPQMKRHGEMFLKSSLKSLSRLLDPIFLILLDPSIFRSFKTLTPGGASDEFRICFYMTAYNSNRVNHVFEILFEVLTYAGPDFVTNMSKLQVETGSLQKLIEIFLGDTQGI
jgi:hypothetical protein